MSLCRAGAYLAFLLTPGLVCAQQASAVPVPDSAHHPAQKTATKKLAKTALPQTQVEVINGTVTQRQVFDADRSSADAKDGCSPVSVEVINGQAWKTMTFNCQTQRPSKTAAAKDAPQAAHVAKSTMQVEILNGTRHEIQLVNNGPREAVPVHPLKANAPPVVVGIVSGDTKRVGGNKQRVVVGIESSGTKVVTGVASSGSKNKQGNAQPVVIAIESADTEISGKSTQPVAVGVEPHPRRAPYRGAVPPGQH